MLLWCYKSNNRIIGLERLTTLLLCSKSFLWLITESIPMFDISGDSVWGFVVFRRAHNFPVFSTDVVVRVDSGFLNATLQCL